MSHPTPATPGYADKEVTKPPDWHGLVVTDVFLNALATGLFLTAALADLATPAAFGAVSVPAYRLALALLVADLACLVLDLGDPLRFHHMLRVFKPLSPMSVGTWFMTAFSLPLTALVAVDLLPLAGVAVAGWVRVVLAAAGVPLAFGAAAYKGVLFSTTAQPGWRDARWLGGYHTASALSLGSALLLGLAISSRQEAAGRLRLAAALLLAGGLIPLALLTSEMWPALSRRYRGSLAALGGVVIGGGVLAPLAAWWSGGAVAVLAGVALALAGGFASRYALVMLPQPRHGGTRPR